MVKYTLPIHMDGMRQKWLKRILGFTFGGVILFLTSFFQDATRKFITSNLGISDTDVVSYVIGGFLIFASIILIFSFGSIIFERLGLRFQYPIVSKTKGTKTIKDSAQTQSEAFVRVYKSRNDVDLEELLKEVKNKYWSLAVTQHKAPMSLAPTIIKMIKEGINFRFLIINSQPNRDSDNKAKEEPEYFRDSQGTILHKHIDTDPDRTLKRFQDEIVAKLSSDELLRLDVRKYNLPITHTMIIIDPDSDTNAKIQVEVFHYVAIEGKQPVFIIEKTKHPEVFRTLLESFENAYKKATPINWGKL